MATNAQTPAQETVATTYLQFISKDEKAVKIEGFKIKAQEAALEVSRTIMNLRSEIASKNSEISGLQRQIPYSVTAEYKAVNELAELNKRLEFATNIKDVRFADAQI